MQWPRQVSETGAAAQAFRACIQQGFVLFAISTCQVMAKQILLHHPWLQSGLLCGSFVMLSASVPLSCKPCNF